MTFLLPNFCKILLQIGLVFYFQGQNMLLEGVVWFDHDDTACPTWNENRTQNTRNNVILVFAQTQDGCWRMLIITRHILL